MSTSKFETSTHFISPQTTCLKRMPVGGLQTACKAKFRGKVLQTMHCRIQARNGPMSYLLAYSGIPWTRSRLKGATQAASPAFAELLLASESDSMRARFASGSTSLMLSSVESSASICGGATVKFAAAATTVNNVQCFLHAIASNT